MYKIIFSRKASKFVSNLKLAYKNKIKDILKLLKENPFAYPYKKIKGENNIYRIRIGNYRVLYEVDKTKKRIIIIKIDKRGRIY